MQALGLTAGAADRLDGMAGKPQLIHAPLYGISDMHCRILPNRWFDEVAGRLMATPAIRRRSRSSRDPPS
jgi:hypothetical protein